MLEHYKDLIQRWQDCSRQNDAAGMRSVIDELMQMAKAGFPLAYYRLGTLCEQRNPGRAVAYFNAAAIGMEKFVGHVGGHAELCLAEMNYYGRGLDQDRDEAILWGERAQALGNQESATLLDLINNG